MPPKKNKPPTDASSSLRRQAEALLSADNCDIATMLPEQVRALVHDLHVHQVELQMQNEELRTAQIELAEARDRYLDLYEFAPVGYLTVDPGRVIREANLTAARILHVDRANLIGSRLESLIAPEDRDTCYLHLRDAADNGLRHSTELRVNLSGGRIEWVLLEMVWHAPSESEEREWRITLRNITARKQAEQALRLAAAEWEQTFDSVPDLIAILDPKHRVIRANRAMAERLGVTTQQCFGDTCYRSVHGLDSPPDFCPHTRAIAERRECVAEVHEERLGGDFLISCTPIYGANGEVTGSVHVARDITERNAAERALRESQAQLQAVVDNIDEGIVACDLEGNLLHWNPAALAMHGFASQDEARHRLPHFAEIFELSTMDGAVLPLEQWPLARLLRGETLKNWEIRIRRLKGDWQRILCYGGTLVRNAQGQPLLAVVTVADATERKQAEEALLQSRQDLDRAQEVGQIGWWRLDTRRDVLTWSDENHRIFGVPKGTPMTYEAFLDIVHPDDRQYVDTKWNAGLHGEPYDIEHRILVAGKVKWVREKAYLEFDREGKLLGGFGITQDITKRKHAEEELRKAHDELEIRVQQRTAELRAAERRYRTLFEQSPDAIVVVDPETTLVLESNDLASRLLGYTPEEFTRLRIADIQILETPEQTSARIKKILREGGDDFETKVRTKQGRIRFVRVSVRAVELFGQMVLHCTLSDITKRKRAEQALRLDEARLEALVKLNDLADAPLGVVADFALEAAVRVTRSRLGFLGFLSDDGSTMYTHAYAEDAGQESKFQPMTIRLADAELWAEIIRQRRPMVMNDCRAFDTRLHGYPGDDLRVARLLGIPLFDGKRIVALAAVANKEDEYQDGDVRQLTLLMAGMWRLVQRQRAEAALRESRAFLQTIVDGVPDAVMVIDRDYRVVLANRVVRDLMGGGDPVSGCLKCHQVSRNSDVPCDQNDHPCPLRHVIASKSPAVVTHSVLDRDGNESLLEIVAAPIFDETGEVVQVIEASRDITARVRAEEQARQRQAELAHVTRLATMGEMATGLAHELNQPLSAIVNYLQGCAESIRADRADRDRLLDSLSRAANQAERAGQIITRLRNFVKKGEPSATAVDLNKVVLEAADLLMSDIRQSGGQLVWALADQLQPVMAEPIQVQQVIVNLIRNSLEAMAETPDEQRRLSIRTTGSQDGFVEVAVCDTGPGFPKGGEQRVFDAFFTTKSSGMGMGLSIGRTIIEAHGGRMWATNNPDRGTTFSFTLPVIAGDHEDDA